MSKLSLLGGQVIRVGLLVGALMCFSSQVQAGPVLPTVGPDSLDDSAQTASGYLKVYSSTSAGSPAAVGASNSYYPYSSYWIYDTTGKKIKTVTNHGRFPVEGPDKVELHPGTYIVKAWSDKDGLVTVPVIIKLARTTTVHLESNQ